jgi:opacity protein-like surface antigen
MAAKTSKAQLLEVNYEDIDRIVKEERNSRYEDGRLQQRGKAPLKKYFFKVNGGFFTGEVMGYTFGASAGLRLGGKFSLAFGFQQSITDDLTADAKGVKYDRFDCRMYSIKSYYNLTTNQSVNPYFGIGIGYASSPHTTGFGKGSSSVLRYGYYDSYFLNPAIGIDIPVGKDNYFFTEINYNWHRWIKTHQFQSGQDDEPRKYLNVVYVSLGVKF